MGVRWWGSAKDVILKGIVAVRLFFGRMRGKRRALREERQGQREGEEAL